MVDVPTRGDTPIGAGRLGWGPERGGRTGTLVGWRDAAVMRRQRGLQEGVGAGCWPAAVVVLMPVVVMSLLER